MKNFFFELKILLLFALVLQISSKNDYEIKNINYSPNKDSLNANLEYTANNFNISDYKINQIRNDNISPIKSLNISISIECDEIFHLKITDKYQERWEVPFTVDEKYKKNLSTCNKNKKNSEENILKNFGFNLLNQNSTNKFEFDLVDNNKTYFHFVDNNFLFTEYLLIFETFLTSSNIYGLGERAHKFKLSDGIYTMWPNDTSNILDEENGGFNLYGTHPFALHRTSSNLFVGIFFNNINAQDFVITSNKTSGKINEENNSVSLEQRTIGGIIDMYLFTGKTPEEVIRKYHKIIGYPVLTPIWSLGWQQCKFGIRNDTYLRSVVDRYEENKLPFDVLWADIDYMEDYRDFTISKGRYNNLPKLVNDIHARDKYFVPIIDIGIPLNTTDKFYNLGNEMNVFIQSNYTKQSLRNVVWPGLCVFPDFFHPNTTKFWNQGLKELNSMLDFDGLWHDMNEPSTDWIESFGKGEVNSTLNPLNNEYENIPYIPGNGNIDLNSRQISINAYNFHNSDNEKLMRIYNTKALNSLMQSKITNEYLKQVNKRPFILSRSSVPGLGRYAIHWLGDNYSTFESMRLSLSGIFNFQMFGFAMMGADICGFNENAYDELCARWHVLGAFYTFSRNHSNRDTIMQEPFTIGKITLNATRKALMIRYSLIRYLYSKLFLASLNGGTVFKPVFFEFPEDGNLFEDNKIENNFMFGDSFIMTPVYKTDENDFEGYLPNANWNEFPTGKNLRNFEQGKNEGKNFTFSGKFMDVNLFMRGGKIVPRQETENPQVFTTNQLRNLPTELIINPNEENKAFGDLIFDDGYKKDVIENMDYLHIKLSFYFDLLIFNNKNNLISERTYEFLDIFVKKIVLFRNNYLQNVKYLRVSLRNGEYENIYLTEGNDNMIEFDFTGKNLKFNEIKNALIIHNGNIENEKLQFLQ